MKKCNKCIVEVMELIDEFKEKDTCGHCCCRFKNIELPEWCKVGEWVYDKVIEEYSQINSFDMAHEIKWGLDQGIDVIIPARKRQFNEEEMLGLAGKVIEGENSRQVILYSNRSRATIDLSHNGYTAEDLIKYNCKIDGKPCYVLEHKNEKGEWVQ